FRDQAEVSSTDTSLVTIFLDGTRVDYGSGFGQAQFIPQQNEADPALKALAILKPQLDEGDHQIDILAKDASGNAQTFAADFTVSAEFNLNKVMNYPNPLTDFTEFTYILTQPADEVRIKIYTVSGRLIRDLEFAPADVGFNKISWDGLDDDGDPLSNGVYFYKIIAKKEEHQAEALEKLVIMR
ncbi:MAG: FlgD immunoglobulin-like domain containing protein, partial [bacterium]